jgi:lactate dehydrogenase-like 2-hydroxyacid dehydrogenase
MNASIMAMRRCFSSVTKQVDKSFKVLFCGHEFTGGFQFTKEALQRFPNVETVQCSRENLHSELKTANVVVPFMCRMGAKEVEIGRHVKMIMQFGIGLEGVDIPEATSAGVWVCKIPSEGTGNAQSCAEHAIFLALSLLRNVHEMRRSLQTGALGNPLGRTLYKSTAIIYGYGGIGKQLLRRLQAFEMNVIVVSRSIPAPRDLVNATTTGHVEFISTDQFQTSGSVRGADILFVCCSQNADNVGMVNSAFLQHLRPGLLIVNVARVSTYIEPCYVAVMVTTV